VEKLDFIDSKFRLAILAAKRAKQLVSGSRKKVDSSSENPLTISMEEIRRGKIKIKILDNDELIQDRDDSSSLLIGEDEDNEDQELEEFLYESSDDLEEDQEEEDDEEDDAV